MPDITDHGTTPFNDDALQTHAGGVPPKRSALDGMFLPANACRNKNHLT